MTYKSYDYSEGKMLDQVDTKNIRKQIEVSRLELYSLIEDSNDFSNQKVISQSQKLDELLNMYEKMKC